MKKNEIYNIIKDPLVLLVIIIISLMLMVLSINKGWFTPGSLFYSIGLLALFHIFYKIKNLALKSNKGILLIIFVVIILLVWEFILETPEILSSFINSFFSGDLKIYNYVYLFSTLAFAIGVLEMLIALFISSFKNLKIHNKNRYLTFSFSMIIIVTSSGA